MSKLVVKDFWAGWCKPCKAQTPILHEVQGVLNNFDLEEICLDTDSGAEKATAYGVMSLPTLIFEVDGKEVARRVGLVPKTKFVELIGQYA